MIDDIKTKQRHKLSFNPSTRMEDKHKKIADFLFEVGTMRKLPRMHQQFLLMQDLSDNIATHSYRVGLIAWFLAKMESADPYRAVMMALLHDINEIRSGDHNYVHKKYVKIFDEEIVKEQLGELPFDDLFEFVREYTLRESKEAVIAKDADLIDQILLLKEYTHQGNEEAEIWLRGKDNDETENLQFTKLQTASAKSLGAQILTGRVSEWWENIWTPKNR